jgi:hypothetical protein
MIVTSIIVSYMLVRCMIVRYITVTSIIIRYIIVTCIIVRYIIFKSIIVSYIIVTCIIVSYIIVKFIIVRYIIVTSIIDISLLHVSLFYIYIIVTSIIVFMTRCFAWEGRETNPAKRTNAWIFDSLVVTNIITMTVISHHHYNLQSCLSLMNN